MQGVLLLLIQDINKLDYGSKQAYKAAEVECIAVLFLAYLLHFFAIELQFDGLTI